MLQRCSMISAVGNADRKYQPFDLFFRWKNSSFVAESLRSYTMATGQVYLHLLSCPTKTRM